MEEMKTLKTNVVRELYKVNKGFDLLAKDLEMEKNDLKVLLNPNEDTKITPENFYTIKIFFEKHNLDTTLIGEDLPANGNSVEINVDKNEKIIKCINIAYNMYTLKDKRTNFKKLAEMCGVEKMNRFLSGHFSPTDDFIQIIADDLKVDQSALLNDSLNLNNDMNKFGYWIAYKLYNLKKSFSDLVDNTKLDEDYLLKIIRNEVLLKEKDAPAIALCLHVEAKTVLQLAPKSEDKLCKICKIEVKKSDDKVTKATRPKKISTKSETSVNDLVRSKIAEAGFSFKEFCELIGVKTTVLGGALYRGKLPDEFADVINKELGLNITSISVAKTPSKKNTLVAPEIIIKEATPVVSIPPVKNCDTTIKPIKEEEKEMTEDERIEESIDETMDKLKEKRPTVDNLSDDSKEEKKEKEGKKDDMSTYYQNLYQSAFRDHFGLFGYLPGFAPPYSDGVFNPYTQNTNNTNNMATPNSQLQEDLNLVIEELMNMEYSKQCSFIKIMSSCLDRPEQINEEDSIVGKIERLAWVIKHSKKN